jgi:hypothetical protein
VDLNFRGNFGPKLAEAFSQRGGKSRATDRVSKKEPKKAKNRLKTRPTKGLHDPSRPSSWDTLLQLHLKSLKALFYWGF